MLPELLDSVRKHNPLVLNITNDVVTQYVANGLLALGASPIMSNAPQEMDELAAISGAVVINIGTLTENQVAAMLVAGKAANAAGVPVVLDPVGVGASTFRRQTVERLLSEIRFSLIRGNVGEIATLSGTAWQTKGVDSGSGQADVADLVTRVAQRHQAVVLASGAVDTVGDGQRVATIHNGTPLFPRITGSGCLLSSVCGAFVAVAKKTVFEAMITAAAAYAVAGELAAEGLSEHQTGQFAVRLLDSLAAVDTAALHQYAEVRA